MSECENTVESLTKHAAAVAGGVFLTTAEYEALKAAHCQEHQEALLWLAENFNDGA